MLTLIRQTFYTVFFLSIFPVFCWGQTIKGTLFNEESEAINFALVSLYQLPDGTMITQGFPSDEGVFNFSDLQEGSYQVFVEGGLGFDMYQSDLLVVKKDSSESIDLGNITLKYATQELDAAVVTAEKIKPVLEYDIDKIVMNVEGTSLGTMPSIMNILQLAPQVAIEGGKVTVLGKSNILLLVNGKQTNLKLESIPASIIESMEIISDPSAKYDANVEAVINIILKKGSLEGIQGTVYAKYIQGVYPRANVGTSIGVNKGKFSANINLDYSYNRIRSITDASRTFEATQPFYYSNTALRQELLEHTFYTDLDLSWAFNPKHSITLTTSYSMSRIPENKVFQTDDFTDVHQGSVIDSTLANETHTLAQGDNWQVQLGYDGKIGEELSISTAVNYINLQPLNNSNYKFDFTNAANTNDNRLITYGMNDTTKAHILIGQFDGSWNRKANRIDFGAKYTNLNTYYSIFFNNLNTTAIPGTDTWFRYNESIYALYLQWKGGWKNIQWRFGFRGEYAWTSGVDQKNASTNLGRFNYFPSAALLWILSDDHYLKLAYNKSIQRVHFFDRSPYEYYTSLYTNFVGNPLLRPQITHSVQLNYILMSRFQFTLYYNEQIDYMNQISERHGSLETFKNINFQNSNFGLSVSGQVGLTDWWKLAFKVSGTGIYTRGENQGQAFNTLSGYANIYLMQSFNLWNWMHIDAIASYRSPYSVAIYNTNHLFFFDVNLRKTFFDDQFTVSIYVSDVFGTNIERNSINFGTQQMEAVHNRDVRTVTLSLMYNFSKGREKEVNSKTTLDENTLNRINKN